MRRETFLEALQRMSRATPFQPFTVELMNGARLISRHPEAIRLEEDLAVFTEPDGTVQLFDAGSVARLVTQVIPPGAERAVHNCSSRIVSKFVAKLCSRYSAKLA